MKNSFNFFNVVREIVLLLIDFCFFLKKNSTIPYAYVL